MVCKAIVEALMLDQAPLMSRPAVVEHLLKLSGMY